jgi:murein DD-endopeptidase MepM/ murein hydrolase activator NlpD
MKDITGHLSYALGVFAVIPWLVSPGMLGAQETLALNQPSNEVDRTMINRDTLVNRHFQFAWKSANGGGVNGIATLKGDGSIAGLGSPNESRWLVGRSGCLLFKHVDGRISTRYDELRLVEGRLHFQGPFLLRQGIIHHLVEVDGSVPHTEHRITPAQADCIKYSKQRFVYLNLGETHVFKLKNGTQREIKLRAVQEHRDPVIKLVRRALVTIDINGKSIELLCAPYAMPTEVNGIRIQVDTTSAWLDIPKRVQFSLWDASDPIVDTDLFGFPLSEYRLFSQGTQAYNEPVHLGHRDGDPAGQRFYHNYGVDLAGYEGRQEVLSCIDGIVVQADREQGDLCVRDNQGLILHFGHLDSIDAEISVGTKVQRGQRVGILGKRGPSGNFSHLHIGVDLSMSKSALGPGRMSRNLNLYPWLVAAFQQESRATMLAVARPFKSVLTGDSIRFDSAALAFQSNILSHAWEFHDGTRVQGPSAEKVYTNPGCYMASLWITDDQGHRDVDFCRIRVYSRSDPEAFIPTLFVTYAPSRHVRVDQAVHFRIWPQGRDVKPINVDFGDGRLVKDYTPYSAITHRFKRPGIHVVTVTGRAGELPVTQKVKVVIDQ